MDDRERTVAIVKPDALVNLELHVVLDHIMRRGFRVEWMAMGIMNTRAWEDFYAEHRERPFFKELLEHMTSGPSVFLVLSKANAIEDWRRSVFDLRDLLRGRGVKGPANVVHGSDSLESFNREWALILSEVTLAWDGMP